MDRPGGVSRSGEKPEPTVTVRMGEDRLTSKQTGVFCPLDGHSARIGWPRLSVASFLNKP